VLCRRVAAGRSSIRADRTDVRCQVCRESVRLAVDRVVCRREHSFDLARQGYLNLAAGGRRRSTGDTASMVAALVAVGPTARHVAPDVLTHRIRALPEPTTVTASVHISAHRAHVSAH
jgi:hypothetical protein